MTEQFPLVNQAFQAVPQQITDAGYCAEMQSTNEEFCAAIAESPEAANSVFIETNQIGNQQDEAQGTFNISQDEVLQYLSEEQEHQGEATYNFLNSYNEAGKLDEGVTLLNYYHGILDGISQTDEEGSSISKEDFKNTEKGFDKVSDLEDGNYGAFTKTTDSEGNATYTRTGSQDEFSKVEANNLVSLAQQKEQEDTIVEYDRSKDREAIGIHNEQTKTTHGIGNQETEHQGYQLDADLYYDKYHGDSKETSLEKLDDNSKNEYINNVKNDFKNDMMGYLNTEDGSAKLSGAYKDIAQQMNLDISGKSNEEIMDAVGEALAYRSWNGKLDDDYIDLNSITRGLTNEEKAYFSGNLGDYATPYTANLAQDNASNVAEDNEEIAKTSSSLKPDDCYGVSHNEDSGTYSIAGIEGLEFIEGNNATSKLDSNSLSNSTHGDYQLRDANGTSYQLNIADVGIGNPERYTLTYTDKNNNKVERKYDQGSNTLTETKYDDNGKAIEKNETYSKGANDKDCSGLATTTYNYDESGNFVGTTVNKETTYNSGRHTQSTTKYDADGNETSYNMTSTKQGEEDKTVSRTPNGSTTITKGGIEGTIAYVNGNLRTFEYNGKTYCIQGSSFFDSDGNQIDTESGADIYNAYKTLTGETFW